MNRIEKLFTGKKKNILSIYFTAGYPSIDDTLPIIRELNNGRSGSYRDRDALF